MKDGRIIKLLMRSVTRQRAERELLFVRRVAAVGLPVWQIEDLVCCEGRWGLVGERLPAKTTSLAKRLMRHPWEIDRWFQGFVALHKQINEAPGKGFPPLRRRLARRIRSSRLPKQEIQSSLKRLRALPDGDRLCHGDLHPANILLADGRLLAIDWASAGRGPRELDVARTAFLLRFGTAPGVASSLLRPLASHYARLYQARRLEEEGMSSAAVTAWRLPIIAARLARREDAERSYFTNLLLEEIARAEPLAAALPQSRPEKPQAAAIRSQSRKEASPP